MSIGHQEVKRVSVKAEEKRGELIVIKVKLNVDPDYTWKTCFQKPREWQDNQSHPKRVRIVEGGIWVNSTEKSLKKDIEWLDKYIDQANECYRKAIKQAEEEMKKQKEQEAKDKQDIERINKMLETL